MITHRGGEKVLAEFRQMFPDASLSTLVAHGDEIPAWIRGDMVVSPLGKLPYAHRFYKELLILHPAAIRRLTHRAGSRLVLSSDASMIKGLRLQPGVKQVCYCHSPPRYLWGMSEDYVGVGLKSVVFNWMASRLRKFDAQAAQRVDRFIANSAFVADRIKRCYNRESTVIYPPVALEDFSADKRREEHYLLVSQLVPYKRVDLAVEAFTRMGKPLIVIGQGSEQQRLAAIAGPTVRLLGRQPFSVIKRYYETCRAFIHPQVEDFGITAVEAQAAGRPVIAFRAGGALETVIEGRTGLFFDEQSSRALRAAVEQFEALPEDAFKDCRANAERFSRARFRNEMKAFLIKHYPDLLADYAWPDLERNRSN
jgi:glycosyltransferase involved in cell wall biosynthesis